MTVSRYMRVASALAEAIDAGGFLEREALPSERALSEEFDVSRETMRKAIKLLEARGYLVSRHGRGTFVAPEPLRDMQRSIEGLSDEAARNGRAVDQEILFCGPIAAPKAVAEPLKLEENALVARVRRIRRLDGAPIGVHDSWLCVDDPDRFTQAQFGEFGSLYGILRNEFGIVLTDAAESISAVSAENDEAEWLNVPPGAPLLRIERLTVAEDLRPIEFCVMKYVQSYSYDTVVRRRNIGN